MGGGKAGDLAANGATGLKWDGLPPEDGAKRQELNARISDAGDVAGAIDFDRALWDRDDHTLTAQRFRVDPHGFPPSADILAGRFRASADRLHPNEREMDRMVGELADKGAGLLKGP